MVRDKTVNMRVPLDFKIAVYNKKKNMEDDLSKFTRKRLSIPMTNVVKTMIPVMKTRELSPDDLKKLAKRRPSL